MPKLWSSNLPPSLRPIRPLRRPQRPSTSPLHHLSTRPLQIRSLTLAYDLHRPPAGKEAKHAPIVIMHGLFGSKQNNRSISKALARDLGCEIYALDLRNHGDSPHDTTHTYMAMADDVEDFIEVHKLRRPVLIGHSMGAKVAMTLALRSPAKVSALIPVDNGPTDAVLKSDFAKYTYGMRKIVEAGVTNAKEADQILQEYEDSLPIRQFLLTNLIRPRPTPSTPSTPNPPVSFRIPLPTLAASLPHMGDFPFRDPSRNRYDGPTLVIRGTKSMYVPDEVLPLIGEFFPRFVVRDLEAGHWVISERPEGVRSSVREFLGEVWEGDGEGGPSGRRMMG